MEFLGYKDVQIARKDLWDTFNKWLEQRYGGWRKILKKAFDIGIEAALADLEVVKEQIVQVCKENHQLLELLTKVTTKTCLSAATRHTLKMTTKIGTKQVVKQGSKAAATQATMSISKTITKEVTERAVIRGSNVIIIQATKSVVKTTTKDGTKQAIKQGSKVTASQGIKSVIKSAATPLSIGADLAQAGLEFAGYNEAGKKVGVYGNVVAGAIVGSTFGLPGAALGALGGFVIWGAGEVVGGLVDRAFGN